MEATSYEELILDVSFFIFCILCSIYAIFIYCYNHVIVYLVGGIVLCIIAMILVYEIIKDIKNLPCE
jgi:hypothetical protein